MDKNFLDFPLEIKSESVTDEGHFIGYGSTFLGDPDSYRDVIAPGAFTKSLEAGGRNGNGVALLWMHDKPLGVFTSVVEDSKGLKVEGQLAMNTQIGREAREFMKMGAVKGMSIGFGIKKHERDEETGIRLIKEIDLWEISVVTFPANVNATITDIKSSDALKQATTERDFEKALRDSGLSKNGALYVTSLCRDSLRDLENETKDELTTETAIQGVEEDYIDDILKEVRKVRANLYISKKLNN